MTLAVEPTQALSQEPMRPQRRRLSRARRLSRMFGWLMFVLFLVALLVPAAALLAVYRTAQMDDRDKTDAIVVLGAAQFQGKPSPVLANRLRHAAMLYNAGVAERIITVGGNQPGDITTEAQAGKRALIKMGIPADAITALPSGRDTLTSIDAVAHSMAASGITDATFVSDPAHMARVSSMAGAFGLDPRVSPTESGPASALTRNYVIRETGGLLRFWLVDTWNVEPAIR